MPVLSSLHQLFDTDTCVAYIHTLRRNWLQVLAM